MSFTFSDLEAPQDASVNYNKFLNMALRVTPTPVHLGNLPFPLDMVFKPCILRRDTDNEILENVSNFETRYDDTFIVSLPRCGSSWLQNIVWLLKHNLDYHTDQTVERHKRMTLFEVDYKRSKGNEDAGQTLLNTRISNLERLAAQKTTRILKTHLPIQFLPKQLWLNKGKIIYITRNPKDQIISLFHFTRNYFQLSLTLEESINMTMNSHGIYMPYMEHVLNYWRMHKRVRNILILKYEDLVNDTFATIKNISEFLECSYNIDQLKQLTAYVSFENILENKAINREDDLKNMEKLLGRKRPDPDYTYFAKGKVGIYRSEMNDEQIEKFDNWIKEALIYSDFTFSM